MAGCVDYHLGRQGGPRVHPAGQPGAMALQRRGAVAAPSLDPMPPGGHDYSRAILVRHDVGGALSVPPGRRWNIPS
jgi:hypothetical protein